MANVLPFARQRDLAFVLSEIDTADAELKAYDALWQSDPDHYIDQKFDDRAGECDNRLADLRKEAEQMIRAATGCDWNSIYARLA